MQFYDAKALNASKKFIEDYERRKRYEENLSLLYKPITMKDIEEKMKREEKPLVEFPKVEDEITVNNKSFKVVNSDYLRGRVVLVCV